VWSEQIRVAASEQRVRTITKLARADVTADLLSDGAGAPLALGVASFATLANTEQTNAVRCRC
jgi:hypothetical protein